MYHLNSQSVWCITVGLAVAFNVDASKSTAHENKQRTRKGSRSYDQYTDASAHALLRFTQNQFVSNGILANDSTTQFAFFRVDGDVENKSRITVVPEV